MNVMLWLTAGALVALLASFKVEAVGRQRLLIDVTFCAFGALFGGLLSVPAEHWFSFEMHWAGMVAAIVGAAVLLLITHLHALRGRR